MKYKPLESLDNNFGINENAEIINFQTGNILSPYIGIDNYQHIVICYKGKRLRKRVHRLMAEAFLNNCKVVDHINNIKSDNRLENLQPITHSANIKKAYSQGQYKSNERVELYVYDIVNLTGFETKSMREAERITGIDRHRIKTFLEKTRSNYTNYLFYYLESVSTIFEGKTRQWLQNHWYGEDKHHWKRGE